MNKINGDFYVTCFYHDLGKNCIEERWGHCSRIGTPESSTQDVGGCAGGWQVNGRYGQWRQAGRRGQ